MKEFCTFITKFKTLIRYSNMVINQLTKTEEIRLGCSKIILVFILIAKVFSFTLESTYFPLWAREHVGTVIYAVNSHMLIVC